MSGGKEAVLRRDGVRQNGLQGEKLDKERNKKELQKEEERSFGMKTVRIQKRKVKNGKLRGKGSNCYRVDQWMLHGSLERDLMVDRGDLSLPQLTAPVLGQKQASVWGSMTLGAKMPGPEVLLHKGKSANKEARQRERISNTDQFV